MGYFSFFTWIDYIQHLIFRWGTPFHRFYYSDLVLVWRLDKLSFSATVAFFWEGCGVGGWGQRKRQKKLSNKVFSTLLFLSQSLKFYGPFQFLCSFYLFLTIFNLEFFKQDLCFYNVYIVNVCIFPVNGGVAIVTFLSREQISYRNY